MYMHTYIPLRKLCPTCRHCKTNRGPPDLRMSLRHVLNFVRNSYIYISYMYLYYIYDVYIYMFYMIYDLSLSIYIYLYLQYLQLPLNCWTSFAYIRPSTLVSVLRIWTAFVFFGAEDFRPGRQAEALLAGGALTATTAPGRSGSTAAPRLSATLTSRRTTAAATA